MGIIIGCAINVWEEKQRTHPGHSSHLLMAQPVCYPDWEAGQTQRNDCTQRKLIVPFKYLDGYMAIHRPSQVTTPQKEELTLIFPYNSNWASLKDIFLRIQVLISLHFPVVAFFHCSRASTYTRWSTKQKLDYIQIVH